ncbi:His Kinase A (phospho-acceptor) domain-containing protein [Mucilaginibacter lappiensis]|uniref:histidine kinase n=1 Tax=Mucilaginibacter lappiensis TaxID=354630 RepID=A0ABR6PS57_9SPHI|nr:ATP-binding protein [Mucilaginibacter lappiensis]MBB6112461.1 signal transduction histidine kinase [Mucilaginibacter lappiensis]SIS00098.1 His Kinase A (phospho-acceptor) domain-containing protein [Mucilaginibacter lappiensis]
MQKRVICFIPLLFAAICSYSQVQDIAKIKKALPHITDSVKYADALNRLGILMYENNLDSTFYYAKRARAISERLKYRQGIADALNTLGIVYDLRGNLQLSLRYYNDAHNHYMTIHDSANVVQTLMNIGLVFSENNEEKKSIEILRKAINMGNKLKKDSIMSLVLCDYLLLYPDRIPKDSITIYLTQARQVATKYKDNRSLLVTDQIQAQLYLKSKQREKGISLLEKTAAKGIAMDLNYLSLDIIQSLGDLYNPVDTAKAIARYKQGLNIADVKGYHMYQKIFGKRLYDIYIARNNLPEVQYYGKKLLKLYDDEEQFNNTSGFDYIDYALKDQQLEAITIRSKNRQIVAIILGVLFLLTAVTVLFIYRLYRLKKKHTVTLEALNRSVLLRNEKLEIDHEFNNRLVSILAHDFRQPIGTLKTLATVLKDADSFTREELMELVDTMEHTSSISLEIFENILQWIKQQLSGFSYEPKPLRLKELIDDALQPFSLIGEEYQLKFLNNVGGDIVIHADKELVQFIHRNFIHNAIKFSPRYSTISISASAHSGETTVCVLDEGKGISSEKMESIFNFKVAMHYNNEKEKGAGVALMICKDFIEKMSGRIWVENGSQKGAAFCYSLPGLK